MKKFKIGLAMISMIILHAGCGTVNKAPQGNVPEDVRRIFVGTWEGEHVNHEGKLLRTWIQNRSADGTYTIIFVHHTKKGICKSRQKGIWWIEENRFYEIAPDVMKEPDAYQFEILSENEIRFKSIVKDYEFVDKRVEAFREPTFIRLRRDTLQRTVAQPMACRRLAAGTSCLYVSFYRSPG